MQTRKFGRSNLDVSPLGLGCWAIGGPTRYQGHHFGWGEIDEDEAIRAIHVALDAGITLFDTADVYGAGHSERILGQGLAGRRDQVLIATKFGLTFEEYSGIMTGQDASPQYIQHACEASLRRLNTDYIDLYQFHPGDYDPDKVGPVCDTLDRLMAEGKIRYYGWNADSERARIFAERAYCTSVQFGMNMFADATEMLAFCDEYNLAAIVNGPLGKGLLTGKFAETTRFPANDLRSQRGWNFQEGPRAKQRQVLEQLRDILTSDGRTLAQAALGALWARSERILPIPGFKTVAQVQENGGAIQYGPLGQEQMQAIADLVASSLSEEETRPF
ncbi:MAG TPA: aldo/keto reductase [Ktedonobacterales bacterium]|jgi:aryl-alcohol dehydrogenase-like predicted oxidoreductase